MERYTNMLPEKELLNLFDVNQERVGVGGAQTTLPPKHQVADLPATVMV